MALSVRLLTSVSVEYRDRFAALASARGVSVSHLLARLVHHAVAELHTSEPLGIAPLAPTGCETAKKYTVRLWGEEAARLERRAKLRQATPSGYVAHLLRAHLRAEPLPCMVVMRRLIATVSLTKRRRRRAMFASALTRPQRSMHLE
jgi:hypothetical protein